MCEPRSRLVEILILYVILVSENLGVWKLCWLSRGSRYSLVAVQSMGSSENCNSNNTQIHQHEHPEVQMKS